MPGEFGHGAHKLEMVHPQRWHGAISAATGFVVAAMGAIALLGAFDAQTVPAILRALERGGELTLVFRISIAGIAVLTGLGWAAVGMRRMFRLWVPPGIPKDFADIETVRTAVTKRVLTSTRSRIRISTACWAGSLASVCSRWYHASAPRQPSCLRPPGRGSSF